MFLPPTPRALWHIEMAACGGISRMLLKYKQQTCIMTIHVSPPGYSGNRPTATIYLIGSS
eukprot:scaffold61862_cov42-Prasinocladus_malaysianus.AAC.1